MSNRDEKFWAKVDSRGPDECWEWTGARQCGKWAYGRLTVDKKWMSAHRRSWELHHGSVPDGMVVRHACDNPPCVNPAHLTVGTYRDNTRDMHDRGRFIPSGVSGERHGLARFTEQDVRDMRSDRASGMTYSAIAAKYGTHKGNVWRICKRLDWKEVA